MIVAFTVQFLAKNTKQASSPRSKPTNSYEPDTVDVNEWDEEVPF
jgi:hypothetical protein